MYDEIKDLGLELDFTTPATDKDIEEFENKLSITLGEQYKTFLKEFGTLEVEYLEFYGYFKDNKGLPSSISATLIARETIENENTKIRTKRNTDTNRSTKGGNYRDESEKKKSIQMNYQLNQTLLMK